MRKNWFVTMGGGVGLFSGLPIVWGNAVKEGYVHTQMPGWLYLFCVCALPISVFIIGLGAKGAAEHSTAEQIAQATEDKKVKE